jgi:hypothetical protein
MDPRTQLERIQTLVCFQLSSKTTGSLNHNTSSTPRNTSPSLITTTTENYSTYLDPTTTSYNTGGLSDFVSTSASVSRSTAIADSAQVLVSAATVERVLLTRVIPILCAIGLAGNIVTLILLASHGLRRRLGRMEKFAASGLAVLAATDAMFCLSVIPMAFVTGGPMYFEEVRISFIHP